MPPSVQTGSPRIGKYVLDPHPLGTGAFGCVYRGRDPNIRRDVAIKVLLSDDDPEMLARFKSEAGTAASLQHNRIVTIHDFGQEDGRPYIVMELLEGQTLQALISEKAPIPLLEKLQNLKQVAEGLEFAHAHHVIHRDIKPANIMRLPSGDAKIMDFGIATLVDADRTRHTREGFAVGTKAYMAPERLRAKPADPRSDIFSFGVLLYEFVTGEYPFSAPTGEALAYQIVAVDPKPMGAIVDCPQALDDLAQRALAKDPDLRYQTMAEVIGELEPITAELARTEAQRIMATVQPLDTAPTEEIEDQIRRVLKLDPLNREARSIRENISERHRRRALEARVRDLVEEGRNQLARRHFGQAIDCFKSACRLEPTNASAQEMLSAATVGLENASRARQLIAEARQSFAGERLEEAKRQADEALALDPDDADAPKLLADISVEMRRREAEQRTRLALAEARLLLASGRLDEAQAAISSAPESDEVVEVGRQIQDAIAERERARKDQIRLRLAISVRQMLRAGGIDQARRYLANLAAEFPQAPEIGLLELEIRTEDVCRQADDLRSSGRIDQAIAAVSDALASGMQFDRLLALKRELETELDRSQRDQEARQAIEQASLLLDRHLIGAASVAINELVRRFPNDPRVRALASAAALRVPEHGGVAPATTIAEPENAFRTIQDLLDRRAFSEALQEIRRAKARGVAGDHIAALEAEASTGVAVQRGLEQAEQLSQAPSFPDLKRRAEGILERHRGNLEIERAVHRAMEREREVRLSAALNDVQSAIATRDWERVRSAVVIARAEFPTEPALDRIETAAVERQRQWRLDELARAVRECFSRRDLASAEQALNGAGLEFRDEPVYEALRRELARRSGYERAIAEAETSRRAGDFAAAEGVIRDAWADAPDARAAALLAVILDERRREQVEIAVRQGREEAERAASTGDTEEPVRILAALCERYPEMPSLAADLRAARLRAEISFVNRTVASLAELEQQQHFDTARQIAEEALLRYPQNPDLMAAARDVSVQAAGVERQTRLLYFLDAIEPAIQKGEWRKARDLIAEARSQLGRDPVFDRLLSTVEVRESEERIGCISESVRARLAAGEVEGAAEVLRDAMPIDRENSRYAELERDIQRHRVYRAHIETAERLRLAGKFDEAERKLNPLLGSAPDNAAASLLQRVLAERTTARKHEDVRQRRSEIDTCVARGELGTALGKAERLCRDYPSDADLIGLKQDVAARLARKRAEEQEQDAARRRSAERVRAIENATAEVDAALAVRDLDRARRAIETCRQIVRVDDRLAALESAVCAAIHIAAMEDLTSATRRCFDTDDLDEAARLLSAATAEVEADPAWRALGAELTTRRDYLAVLKTAERMYGEGDRRGAERALRRALGGNPPDSRASDLLAAITGTRARKTRLPLVGWVGACLVAVGVLGVALFTYHHAAATRAGSDVHTQALPPQSPHGAPAVPPPIPDTAATEEPDHPRRLPPEAAAPPHWAGPVVRLQGDQTQLLWLPAWFGRPHVVQSPDWARVATTRKGGVFGLRIGIAREHSSARDRAGIIVLRPEASANSAKDVRITIATAREPAQLVPVPTASPGLVSKVPEIDPAKQAASAVAHSEAYAHQGAKCDSEFYDIRRREKPYSKSLEVGETFTVSDPDLGALPWKDLNSDPPGIEIVQFPQRSNRCAPLVVRNNGPRRVSNFTLHFTIDIPDR